MASRAELERDLLRAAGKVHRCEEATKAAACNRDRLVLELRRVDPQPSLRTVADLAGISHAQVRNLEQADG